VRILFSDIAKRLTTIITSDNETPGYPAQNLNHNFLDVQYISIFADDIITLDLGSDMSMNCVFLAWLNAAVFDIEIRNNANSIVYSQADYENGRSILPIYLGSTVTARYIQITADASLGLASFIDSATDLGIYLKMKGIGCGVYFETADGGPRNGHDLGFSFNTTFFKSKSGQVISTQFPMLAVRKWDFAAQSYEATQDFFDNLKLLGTRKPTYIDFFPLVTDSDPPLYCSITENINGPTRRGVEFVYSFEVEEAR
jgi:hypothetical protein